MTDQLLAENDKLRELLGRYVITHGPRTPEENALALEAANILRTEHTCIHCQRTYEVAFICAQTSKSFRKNAHD